MVLLHGGHPIIQDNEWFISVYEPVSYQEKLTLNDGWPIYKDNHDVNVMVKRISPSVKC